MLCSIRKVAEPPITFAENTTMLWTIAIILFVLWILGFLVFHLAGGLIHILLILAVIVVLYRLFTGRSAV